MAGNTRNAWIDSRLLLMIMTSVLGFFLCYSISGVNTLLRSMIRA
jgi:hypothetical protein